MDLESKHQHKVKMVTFYPALSVGKLLKVLRLSLLLVKRRLNRLYLLASGFRSIDFYSLGPGFGMGPGFRFSVRSPNPKTPEFLDPEGVDLGSKPPEILF